MSYKFQKLEVYQIALDYVDKIYRLSRELPASEKYNLQNQLERAATSIVLNIAEGSTGQSDAEQRRFLGLALRSYLETVACFDIIERQGYLPGNTLMEIRELGHELFIKLQAFRKALACGQETKGGKETGDRRQKQTEDGRQKTGDSRPRSPVSSQSSVSGQSPSSVSRPQYSPEGES